MPRLVVMLLLATGLSCDSSSNSGPPPVADGTGDSSIMWDGEERRFQLYVPPSYDEANPSPLILAFHGQSGDAKNMQNTTDIDAEANRQSAVAAYLDDLVGDWAEGCGCARADAMSVDDPGFAIALIDSLAADYNIDQARVYATGFSIGGLFVQRLACEHSDVFAGVASVGSTMSVPLSQSCPSSDPIDIVIALGSNDTSFPWSGNNAGIFSTLSADSTAGVWVTNNSCARTPVPGQSSLGNFTVNSSIWETCEGGGSMTLHRIEGGGHAWYPGTGNFIGSLIDGTAPKQ